jgi:hypothetical protein
MTVHYIAQFLVSRTAGVFRENFRLNGDTIIGVVEEIQKIGEEFDNDITVVTWRLTALTAEKEYSKPRGSK